MSTQPEVIQAFMKSLDKTKNFGESALNKAISASSPFRNLQAVRESLIEDCGTNAQDVDDFLKTYCGINLNTKDTGAVTGSEMNNVRSKTDATIIAESGDLKTSFKDSSFTVNDLSVKLANSKTFNSLSESEQFIWQGLYTWWIEGALNLISKSYGENFGFGKKSTATIKTLAVEFIDDSSESAIAISNLNDSDATELKLTINMHDYASLKADYDSAENKANSKANTEFDRAVAHELAYAVMRANITYDPVFKSLSGFVIEGLAELITGIKTSNADGIKSLAADVSQFEVGLDEKNLGRYEDFMYEGGYLFFRYLARQSGDLTIANKTADTIVRTFYGNDTITNYASNVTILSNGHDDYNAGDDVIYLQPSVSVSSVSSGKGKDYISLYAKTKNNTVNGGAGNDTISSRGETALIYGDDGGDEIYLYATAANNTAYGGKGNDFINSSATSALIYGEDGNDYIQIYSGAASNTIYGGKGNDTVFLEENAANHWINTGEGKDVVHNEASNVSMTTEDGEDYIQIYSNAKNSTVDSGADKDSIYSGATNVSINAGDDDDYIHIYADAVKNTVMAGAGDDKIKSYSENGVLYQYASGDGNDSISGFTAKDTLSISTGKYSSARSGNDVIVTVGDGKITLEGAVNLSKLNIVDASSISTLLTVTDSSNATVTVGSAVRVINASKRTKAVKITGNKLANTISGGSKNDTLSGGAGNDSIIGNAGNDKLYGNAGNDTLIGGAGNDTLTGGDDDDIFIYSAGKDVIADYATGDKISLGAAVSKATVDGSDVVLTFKNGSLTVKDAKGQSLSMINSSGKSFSTVLGSSSGGSSSGSKTLTVSNSTKSPVTVGSSYGTIDASNRTKSVKITGNAQANSIKGGASADTILGGAGNDSIVGNAGNDSLLGNAGNDKLWGGAGNDKIYGGDGNDSLWGGKGNDSLWGGDGSDVFTFIAGQGTDYVMDYESSELLRLYNSSGKSQVSFSKSAFSNSKLTLTINGGGSIILSGVTKSTAFNINGTSYKISGSKLTAS